MTDLNLFSDVLRLFTNADSKTWFIMACVVNVILLIVGIVTVSKSPFPGETAAQIATRKKRGNSFIGVSITIMLIFGGIYGWRAYQAHKARQAVTSDFQTL